MTYTPEQIQKIRTENDLFRESRRSDLGCFRLSYSIHRRSMRSAYLIDRAIETTSIFDDDLHTSGRVNFKGTDIVWIISHRRRASGNASDAKDLRLQSMVKDPSPDPTDLNQTYRVITIMKANEWRPGDPDFDRHCVFHRF